MDDAFKPLQDRLKRHQEQLGSMPAFVWATVTSVSPLRVTLDGPDGEVPVSPTVYGEPPELADRVLIVRNGTSLTILPQGGSGGGGGGGRVRATVVATGASGNMTVDMGKDTFALVSLQSSAATRVRAYRSTADRTADAIRPIGVRPTIQGRVMFEFIFHGANTYNSTGYDCFLPPGTTDLYLAVSATADLTFTIER